MNIARMASKHAWPLLALLALTLGSPHVRAEASAKSQCFNFDALTPELRARSEHYLLRALDTEHLFTLVSGMKPMSAGFYSGKVSPRASATMSIDAATALIARHDASDAPESDETQAHALERARALVDNAQAWQTLEDLRRILPTWRCGGEIHAEIVHYATPRGGQRYLHGAVFSLPALRTVLADKHAFFERWGFTPQTHPVEVLMAVEYARDVSRFAGYGYLFGYPEEAVRFFAGASAEESATGMFVERDFRAIPTFERDTGQFTYAVPRGAVETETDRAVRARAARILEAYKARRADYIGPGKPGVAALLRDWFCPTDDYCSPSNAAL